MSKKRKKSVRTLVRIALLSAIAAILMYFEFPLPFAPPDIYKFDLSEVPVLIGAWMMGPLVGCIIEAVKILLHLFLKGTHTAMVGEFANFIVGCALVLPAAWVYRKKRKWQGLVTGSILGILVLTIVGALMNYFVLLPLYSAAFHIPLEVFVDFGHAVNPKIVDVKSLIVLVVIPFNLVKGIIVCLISVLLYSRIGKLLERS